MKIFNFIAHRNSDSHTLDCNYVTTCEIIHNCLCILVVFSQTFTFCPSEIFFSTVTEKSGFFFYF